MRVDGVPNVKTCVEPVTDGMIVECQMGKGEISIASEVKVQNCRIETDVAIVGAGPAGLSAAMTASQLGLDVVVIDENPIAGGQLIKQTHKFFGSVKNQAGIRGTEIAKLLVRQLKDMEAEMITGASVIGSYEGGKTLVAVQNNYALKEIHPKKIIVATGSRENFLVFPNNDLPGVCGAGGVQTLVNVYGIKPGENALIVGSGNVGLILGYQLLQAGINVKAVVEAMPRIGGYLVHASKLRRMGVPILTAHTIKRAIGKDCVEGATLIALDEEGKPAEGTEQDVEVDLICLAVGLTPSSELLFQAGCKWTYLPELGGYVAIHSRDLETTKKGVYVAGDASGIEEADTAMMEGKIAGADAAIKLGVAARKTEKIKIEDRKELDLLRASPFSERVKIGKQRVWTLMEDYE